MSDEYTPTTEILRNAWISHRLNPDHYGRENFGRGGNALTAEFDRWLAEYTREVAAKALEDYADTIGVLSDEEDRDYWRGWRAAQRAALSKLEERSAAIREGRS